jgi:membrane associated rhomboid family serine protease
MFPIKDDQPSYSTPFVNWFLIALNILVFVFELQLTQSGLKQLFNQFALVPAHVWNGHYSVLQNVVPFFTSMFLHDKLPPLGWGHVLGNMWFLYIFGDNVEDRLGHFKYLLFYLLAGLFADAAQIAIYPNSHVGMVGASGAVAGVLGAYFLLYPRARVLTWFFVFVLYLPAWIVLGEWFVMQFFSGAAVLSIMEQTGKDVGGVAFFAHIGGFLAGMVMIKIFPERARRYPYAYR